MHQSELKFGEVSWTDGLSKDAKRLCFYLKGKGQVMGKHIQEDLGWCEKKLRDIRAQTNGAIVSGPGFPGYRLALEVKIKDFDRIIAARRSQCLKMDKDTTAQIRFYHRHGPPNNQPRGQSA